MLRCMTQKQDVVEVTKRVIKRRGRRITPTEVVTKDNENHEASSWMFLSDKWVSLPVYFFVTSSQLLVIIPYSSFFLLFSTQHQSRHCFVFFSSAFICRHFLTLTRCEERRRKKERRGQEKEDLAKEPGPSRLEKRREGSVRMKVTLFGWERDFFSSLFFSPLCVVFWWASLFLVSSLERHCIKQLLLFSRKTSGKVLYPSVDWEPVSVKKRRILGNCKYIFHSSGYSWISILFSISLKSSDTNRNSVLFSLLLPTTSRVLLPHSLFSSSSNHFLVSSSFFFSSFSSGEKNISLKQLAKFDAFPCMLHYCCTIIPSFSSNSSFFLSLHLLPVSFSFFFKR